VTVGIDGRCQAEGAQDPGPRTRHLVVVVAIRTLRVGGAESLAWHEAVQLLALGYEVEVWYQIDGPFRAELAVAGVKTIRVPLWSGRRRLKSLSGRARGQLVVHTHSPSSGRFPAPGIARDRQRGLYPHRAQRVGRLPSGHASGLVHRSDGLAHRRAGGRIDRSAERLRPRPVVDECFTTWISRCLGCRRAWPSRPNSMDQLRVACVASLTEKEGPRQPPGGADHPRPAVGWSAGGVAGRGRPVA
jgi:hypothetical protein